MQTDTNAGNGARDLDDKARHGNIADWLLPLKRRSANRSFDSPQPASPLPPLSWPRGTNVDLVS